MGAGLGQHKHKRSFGLMFFVNTHNTQNNINHAWTQAGDWSEQALISDLLQIKEAHVNLAV